MHGIETLEEFYRQRFNQELGGTQINDSQFNVFGFSESSQSGKPLAYRRRDFYKIMLIKGINVIHYPEKSILINGSALTFFNPDVPYQWEQLSKKSGYFCLFKDGFFNDQLRNSLKILPVFALDARAIYMLDKEQYRLIEAVFKKMRKENDSIYPFKHDLIRNYIIELIHQAMKLTPLKEGFKKTDANSRITAVFRDLLERQFPISSIDQSFQFRSPAKFAEQLNIHINHLNRAVKKITGKTTTTVIKDRLLIEAKALLGHTDWNVAEIGYCLGFYEMANFNHFFKKNSGMTPGAYRQLLPSIHRVIA